MITIPEGVAVAVEVIDVQTYTPHNTVSKRTMYTVRDEEGNTAELDQANVGRGGWQVAAKIGDRGKLRYVPFSTGSGYGMTHSLELEG